MPTEYFDPVSTLAQLDALNDDDIVRGYRDGFGDTPNHTRRDQAYWHGYFNARSDREGYSSPEQQQLARLYVERMRAQ